MADADDAFLSRWSRRKLRPQAQAPVPAAAAATATESVPAPPGPSPAAAAPAPAPAAVPARPEPPPPPPLDDVAVLDAASDYTRFVARDVDPTVKNAALKKLFADPRFNVMDGLDTYIDDYGKPDPLPASMLRQMVQSQLLGLFKDEEPPAAAAADNPPALAAPPEPGPPADEDADLQLQPDDAAGPDRPGAGAGADPRREL